jgi:predicted negative regulator of RcsB-dependent stress response
MSAIGAGTFLAYTGHPTEGISAIITALVGLIGVFGWGSYQRRKERNARINQ